MPGISTIILSLSSIVGGGFGTAGLTKTVLEVEGASVGGATTRDQSCQLGSSEWTSYESVVHQ